MALLISKPDGKADVLRLSGQMGAGLVRSKLVVEHFNFIILTWWLGHLASLISIVKILLICLNYTIVYLPSQ